MGVESWGVANAQLIARTGHDPYSISIKQGSLFSPCLFNVISTELSYSVDMRNIHHYIQGGFVMNTNINSKDIKDANKHNKKARDDIRYLLKITNTFENDPLRDQACDQIVNFVAIWALCEHDIFKTYGSGIVMNLNKISNEYLSKNATIEYLEGHIKYFYERYSSKPDLYENNFLKKNFQNRDLDYKFFSDDKRAYDALMDSKGVYGDFRKNDEEKLAFLLFVIYRYRNNIYHGTKGVNDWIDFYTPIQHCIDALLQIRFNWIDREHFSKPFHNAHQQAERIKIKKILDCC